LAAALVGATIGCTPAPTPGPASATPSSPARSAGARFDPTGLALAVHVVANGLSAPTDTSAGDASGRLFVVEQAGRIRIVEHGAVVVTPFLDIRAKVSSGGERGLLGLAFHPGFPTDPRFFVDYTDVDGNTVVSEFRVAGTNPNRADPGSERILLHVDQPFANHNGGGIVFGRDGMLYISLGDGGGGGDPQGNGQKLDTLLAKILRIDVDGQAGDKPYGVPADNPFVDRSGARPEIWLTGLRNPWRLRFDRATGDLWIGDVGQGLWEEVDVARAGVGGLNYGWNVMEGFHCFLPSTGCDQTGLTLPVAEYGHNLGCAIIGGVVVHDARQGKLNLAATAIRRCVLQAELWVIDPTSRMARRLPSSPRDSTRTRSPRSVRPRTGRSMPRASIAVS
jgi:glucose/arabinose dehydrogenase